MHIRATMKKHVLVLSLFLHLFFLLSLSFVISFKPVVLREKAPYLYVPSYVYSESKPVQNEVIKEKVKEKLPTTEKGIEKVEQKNKPLTQSISKPKTDSMQPVHLLGEKDVDKPLLKVLGTAFYAHLTYPKSAIDFNVKGVAQVGFTIHPDGSITDVKLVRSSGAAVLDEAALKSVSLSSPVKNASTYVKESRYLVVGVIFGGER